MDSNDNLPAVPEENFTQKREITVDSYSESISSDDDPSDDRTITADSDSSAAPTFEETPCKWEANPKGTEATLHQIAASLQSAAEGYLNLALHMSKVVPYELPQVIAQIPPPPMDVPMPIRKALLIDGESKVVSHLIHGEYKLTNTSWSKLQKKYHVSRDKVYSTIKGRRRPRGKSRNLLNLNLQYQPPYWWFVACSHIYPGFTGKVSSLTHFPLEPGCEDYAFLDQAVTDFEQRLDSILTDSLKTPELDISLEEPDAITSSVSSGFLHLVSTVSDTSKLQLAPSIHTHKLWCQARALLAPVSLATKMSASKLIHYFCYTCV